MNARTAKMLHRYALIAGALNAVKRNARQARRKWLTLTPLKRAAMRKAMLEQLQ